MNVRDHGIAVRSKAIGMLEAGVSLKDVALRLGVGLRSIKRWWAAAKCGHSLETKARSGRPKTLNRAAKIVIAKSLEKRRHSTRNIAKSLAEKGYSASSSTVYRHLTKNLGARAFKRPQIPRITERVKGNRLLFAHNHKDWTIEDWRKVL
ncbi:Transposable element Tcb1 transposase [Oopsacas minuta]|uniref:Transposable element Tcb1 transposase n=1 Tax=Oopsacas minuta TaxID=111878 RepID=A0AAV7JXB2_9METZ|nr:Transposable element Tcb1 transposase [Oopsacas minuta]